MPYFLFVCVFVFISATDIKVFYPKFNYAEEIKHWGMTNPFTDFALSKSTRTSHFNSFMHVARVKGS